MFGAGQCPCWEPPDHFQEKPDRLHARGDTHLLLVPLKEPDLVLRIFLSTRAMDPENDPKNLLSDAVTSKAMLRLHNLLEGEILEGWLPLHNSIAASSEPVDITPQTHVAATAVWLKCALHTQHHCEGD